jgi:hypothetical protein
LARERTRRVTPAIPFLRKNQCDFPCNIVPGYATLPCMKGKDTLIPELTRVASSMMQGSLSQIARRCGDPACACFRDPARRHGPHLYWNFRPNGQTIRTIAREADVRQERALPEWNRCNQRLTETRVSNITHYGIGHFQRRNLARDTLLAVTHVPHPFAA